VPYEFEIVRKDVELIDNKLQVALETATWSDYDQVYIDDLHADLKNLHTRTMQTKANVEKIVKSLKQWGSQPMYYRHDNSKTSLMNPDDFPGMIVRRQLDCKRSKVLIDDMVDENFRLFFNQPLKPPKKQEPTKKQSLMESMENIRVSIDDAGSEKAVDRPSETDVGDTDKAAQVEESRISIKSVKPPSISNSVSGSNHDITRTTEQIELFRPYEEYIDTVIWKEVRDSLRVSVKYIKFEMKNRYEHNAPIFEAKLELQPPYIVFFPFMDTSLSNPKGLLEIISMMIANIFNISDMIPLVAQPPQSSGDSDLETFAVFLEASEDKTSPEVQEIESMQMDILSLSRDTIRQAIGLAKYFEKYNFLWLTDKKTHLKNFLKYGRILTKEEAEKIEEGTLELKEMKPTLESFKTVIDFYGELYEEVNANKTIHIFDSWLRVNMKGLKYTILNETCKWSLLFKQYLRDKVVQDLKELEIFIVDSSVSLNQEATNEDSVTLLMILKTIGIINDRTWEIDSMFKPLKKIVDLLISYDMSFDDYVNNQFAELPERWITLKKNAVMVKAKIAPVQAYQVDLIKKRISLFDLRTKLYHEKFMKSPIFSVPCINVYKLCDVIHEELREMERQIHSLRESATHFQLNPPEEGKLNQCRKLIRMIKQIWDFLHAVSSCIDDWKMTAWKKINVDDMETECKKFSKDMRNFEKEIKVLKPFLETEAMIKNLLTSLRAIIELQNPAIRERHWTELMVATKVCM
jgi:dynein heavy chain, axonemal